MQEDTAYRQAAARISGCRVRHNVSVNRSADGDGAFVECVVWVPREEMEKEQGSARPSATRSLEGQVMVDVFIEAPETAE